MSLTRMDLFEEVKRLRDALAVAEAERDWLREAGKELAAVLESTLYTPSGFTGPPVWWNDKARAALDAWVAALAAGTEGS